MENFTYHIVGGNFGKNPKSSKIVDTLHKLLGVNDSLLINGGSLSELPDTVNGNLSIWMPNIENEEEKHYPKKKPGTVLVCSKVMRDGYTRADSTARIFAMHANAVIEIYKEERFRFVLADALGNVWCDTSELSELAFGLLRFYAFTSSSVRISMSHNEYFGKLNSEQSALCEQLININGKLADIVRNKCGKRFFGNISTRCQYLFPSMSFGDYIIVSPRNSDKRKLRAEDMVIARADYTYYGDRKPSVDTPCQIKIYLGCPQVNYIIHGHAYLDDAPFTQTYRVCGDVRESREVIELIGNKTYGALNLKNHGFLIYADTLEHLESTVEKYTQNVTMPSGYC